MPREGLRSWAQSIGIHGVGYYLGKLNFTRKIHVDGAEMKIPWIRGITCNSSEPWMNDLLSLLLKIQSGVFLDAGVNVGQTLIKVKALDPSREYLGFEPNPACVFYVLDLIQENNFKNCTLLPVGLYTEDCILPLDLFSDDITDSMGSLIDNFRPERKVYSRIFVPVFRYDSLAKLVSRSCVGIVKIDVEGSELEVIKSLLKVIERDRPIILVEVLPAYPDDNFQRRMNRQGELEHIFTDVNFAILRVEKTNINTFSGLRQIEKFGIHTDSTMCDYVIVPNEKLANLKTA
ncbi:MAG: FkbM family methyltransferase [Anaerolineales bacterium]